MRGSDPYPGGIIADEMGLGKTVQIAAFLGALKHRSPLLNWLSNDSHLAKPLSLAPFYILFCTSESLWLFTP